MSVPGLRIEPRPDGPDPETAFARKGLTDYAASTRDSARDADLDELPYQLGYHVIEQGDSAVPRESVEALPEGFVRLGHATWGSMAPKGGRDGLTMRDDAAIGEATVLYLQSARMRSGEADDDPTGTLFALPDPFTDPAANRNGAVDLEGESLLASQIADAREAAGLSAPDRLYTAGPEMEMAQADWAEHPFGSDGNGSVLMESRVTERAVRLVTSMARDMTGHSRPGDES